MPIITNLKHLGRFQIHIKLIEKADDYQLKKLFGKCIITRAEMILHTGAIDYVALSDDFDLVKPGEQIPFYQWAFDAGVWKAKRINEENFYKSDNN